MKTLIIYESYRHGNTKKIVDAMSGVLGAELKKPGEVDLSKLDQYDLIGFGSGIFGMRHHESLLKLAGGLPRLEKKAFIFSTSWLGNKDMANHKLLKDALSEKGLTIVGEFTCKGSTFLLFNRGRPNADDLEKTRNFAVKLAGLS